MQALVLVTLADLQKIPFANPLLARIKLAQPELQVLDVDGHSESTLINGGCRLLQEAEKRAVYFKVEPENIPLGASLKLLETVLQPSQPTLILIQGQHRQLKAICTARPYLRFMQSESEETLRKEILEFFSEESR